MRRQPKKGFLGQDGIQKIYKWVKYCIHLTHEYYLQQNIRHPIKHLASRLLLEILPPEAILIQKTTQGRISPINQTVPRLTGYFHEFRNKQLRHITQQQQKTVQDSIWKALLYHKVISHQYIADLAKKTTTNPDFLPSIFWSRRFLNQRPRLKKKIFQVKQLLRMKRQRPFQIIYPKPYKIKQNKLTSQHLNQNQEPYQETKQQKKVSFQDERIIIADEKVKKSSKRQPRKLIVTQIQTNAPEQTRQKKKYNIERQQLAIQEKAQENTIQDDLQIFQPRDQLPQESNYSPLICHYLSHDNSIDLALALQQQEIKDLPNPFAPRKF